jgi:hypothetical protein
MDSSLVNELLTQMDGIDKPKRLRRWVRRLLRMGPAKSSHNYNILVIGATNRAQTLDPALLRAGRFDRKIHVSNPTEDGRKDVIAYYLKKVSHVPIDIDRMAKATSGYSPAAIKGVINEALIFALQDGRDALTYDDIWKAKVTDEIGLVEQVVYSEWQKTKTALHEAAHAVASQFLRPRESVQIVTVRKRGGTLGLVWGQEDEERFSDTRSDMLADIKVSLAGMVAEEIWFGESTTGPSSDLQAATRVAVQMVTQLGMGHSVLSLGVSENSMDIALRSRQVREDADAVLQQCKEEIREFLEGKRSTVEAVRDALIERDELTGDEFRMLLFRIGAIPQPPRLQAAIPFVRVGGGFPGEGDGHLHGSGNDQPAAPSSNSPPDEADLAPPPPKHGSPPVSPTPPSPYPPGYTPPPPLPGYPPVPPQNPDP